ncbi:MAG: LysM peptidoglycan-binding domain-containing protein, partial [Sulfurovum sp.]
KKSIKPHLISHYVSLGETLESIAKLYRTDIDEIIISNHLEDNFLELDSLLVIPVSKKTFDEMSK